ncbi:MAG TPA: SDR family oxidoreductase [Nocardioidaceae bacterium]|jgi:NAD(P)-dependent dehydrogenase (short-subunit alcohol dehydrogenase family)|nr:SDR family oxidoreductase [Nocardioidaceae bacterium]
MTDQTQQQDPSSQHTQPDTESEGTLAHPGVTSDMREQPDHGEKSYRGSGRLQDKRTIITGGDSGIGRAVALAFAREGADVVISYLPEEEDDAQETVRLVEDAGRKAVTVPGDIRDEAQCRLIIDTAVQELGGIDVLVNNAAYQMAQPDGLAAITNEQFDRTVKTNLYAMFWLCKYALPHLTKGASIINTASVQSTTPSPPLLDYATTKGGIMTFTEGLAQSLGEQGIRVNAVAPGPIWTPLIPATMPEDMLEGFGATTPLGRAGQPSEVAPAYVYLASQESSYVTGEVLAVTGGKPL